MAEYKYQNKDDDGFPDAFTFKSYTVTSTAASKQAGGHSDVNLRTASVNDRKKLIMKCVGQIAVWYGQYGTDGKKSFVSGTGTVIEELANGYYLVVSCAHNFMEYSETKNIKSYPKDVYFFPNGMRNPKMRMKCVEDEIYGAYDPSKKICANDLSVSLFHDKKGIISAYYDDIDINGAISCKVWKKGDDNRFDLWGFPTASNGLLQGQYGGKARVNDRGLWLYDNISTYRGQSGSAVFQERRYKENTFNIYGIHIWGNEDTQDDNCGVFLDQKKLNWIQQKCSKLKQLIFVENDAVNVAVSYKKATREDTKQNEVKMWFKNEVGLDDDVIEILFKNKYNKMEKLQFLNDDKLNKMGMMMGDIDIIMVHLKKLPFYINGKQFKFKKENWNEITNNGKTVQNIPQKKDEWTTTYFGNILDHKTDGKYCFEFRMDEFEYTDNDVGIVFSAMEWDDEEDCDFNYSDFNYYANGQCDFDPDEFDFEGSAPVFFQKKGDTITVIVNMKEKKAIFNGFTVLLTNRVRLGFSFKSFRKITVVNAKVL